MKFEPEYKYEINYAFILEIYFICLCNSLIYAVFLKILKLKENAKGFLINVLTEWYI